MKEGFSFVLVAAGKGKRLGGKVPKQFAEVAGLPMWEWSARLAEDLWKKSFVKELVLVLPPEELAFFRENPPRLGMPVKLAAGGEERHVSVLNGILAASGEYVLVHDAARPLATEALCLELVEKVLPTGGAVPVLALSDALKQVSGTRLSPLKTDDVLRAQTPQAFARLPLVEALERYGRGVRDESEAWFASGREVALVQGESRNIKITFPGDLPLADSLLAGSIEWRTGHGFDVHPLVPHRPLVLGGIHVPSKLGLEGHSDADCLCHAAADAILGAAGLPDIGTLFPSSDPVYKGVSSVPLFKEAVGKARREGWVVRWIDMTLVAQVPRLSEHVPRIIDAFERYLEVPVGIRRVNLKVKSGEAVGPVGEGACMECHAVSTLSRRKPSVLEEP